MSGEFYGPGGPACTPDDTNHKAPTAAAHRANSDAMTESAPAEGAVASPNPRGRGIKREISKGARDVGVPEH